MNNPITRDNTSVTCEIEFTIAYVLHRQVHDATEATFSKRQDCSADLTAQFIERQLRLLCSHIVFTFRDGLTEGLSKQLFERFLCLLSLVNLLLGT